MPFVFQSEATIPTKHGLMTLAVFLENGGGASGESGSGSSQSGSGQSVGNGSGKDVIVAYRFADAADKRDLPVRVHDACATSELFGSIKCDCALQLDSFLERLAGHGGMLIYMPQEGRGIGLANKLRAYAVQDSLGLDTVEANRYFNFPDDCRSYGAVRDVLVHFGVPSIRLFSNNPRKVAELTGLGVVITSRESIVIGNLPEQSAKYLQTKVAKMGHVLQADNNIKFYEPDEPWGFLSNFFLHPFADVAGRVYATTEHYYQAWRFDPSSALFTQIAGAATPREAFELSRANKVHYLPTADRLAIMADALRLKFTGQLADQLVATAPHTLVEASPCDTFWGQIPDGTGDNHLGQLLMRLRSELMHGASPPI